MTVELGTINSSKSQSWFYLLDIPINYMYTSTECHLTITTELSAQKFGIGHEHTKETICATLQQGTCSAILPIGQRYCADRLCRVWHHFGKFTTDTFIPRLILFRVMLQHNCLDRNVVCLQYILFQKLIKCIFFSPSLHLFQILESLKIYLMIVHQYKYEDTQHSRI